MTEQQHLFVERVHEAQGILRRICAVYNQDEDIRKDLRQEMLFQLRRAYPSFRKESLFSTWMYRVALNTALMYRRGKNVAGSLIHPRSVCQGVRTSAVEAGLRTDSQGSCV